MQQSPGRRSGDDAVGAGPVKSPAGVDDAQPVMRDDLDIAGRRSSPARATKARPEGKQQGPAWIGQSMADRSRRRRGRAGSRRVTSPEPPIPGRSFSRDADKVRRRDGPAERSSACPEERTHVANSGGPYVRFARSVVASPTDGRRTSRAARKKGRPVVPPRNQSASIEGYGRVHPGELGGPLRAPQCTVRNKPRHDGARCTRFLQQASGPRVQRCIASIFVSRLEVRSDG